GQNHAGQHDAPAIAAFAAALSIDAERGFDRSWSFCRWPIDKLVHDGPLKTCERPYMSTNHTQEPGLQVKFRSSLETGAEEYDDERPQISPLRRVHAPAA